MKLRESTGLGMMTCKKALIEADGDMDKAVENLRKQGQATATKRAGRTAKEGKVNIKTKDPDTLIFEVNSETDFVARNEDFLEFVSNLGDVLLESKPDTREAALNLTSPLFDGQTVEAKTLEIVGKIGEKISLRRFEILTVDPAQEKLFTYTHGIGKIGVAAIIKTYCSQSRRGSRRYNRKREGDIPVSGTIFRKT
jgi:elongation factor Ts